MRGKQRKPEVLAWYRDLDCRLEALRTSVVDGSFVFGTYEFFTIHDPKERIISAASFPERIVHHALMNVLDPLFERYQISASYACRRGKGTSAAVLAAFNLSRRYLWFLKMDVRKYFDSIDHGVLKTRLLRIIADPPVLGMLDAIIDSYETSPGKGLPIGNLTSQYFANHYLGALDHQVKERDRIGPWVRYMDDMLAFADNAVELRAVYHRVVAWCGDVLKLNLKPAIVGTVVDGVPFLGFLLKPEGIHLTRKTKQRFSRKAKAIDHEMRHGTISERDAADRVTAMAAHVSLARSNAFRYHVFHGRGLGDQAGESRRELEQRRVERAFGQSEQQHSR